MAERITGHTELVGLMAYPIRHSSSPAMHNEAFAYRCMDDILEVIGETVCVDQIIRPIYNFKAGRKKKRNTLKDEK